VRYLVTCNLLKNQEYVLQKRSRVEVVLLLNLQACAWLCVIAYVGKQTYVA